MACDQIAVFMNLHVLNGKKFNEYIFFSFWTFAEHIKKKLFFILTLFDFRVNVENNAIHVILVQFLRLSRKL